MLVHPIIDKLQALRFFGMRCAYEEQLQMPDIDLLNFDERLGLLVDREMTERDNRRFKTRLRKAKLRLNACVEDVDFRYKRGLDKTVFMQLADCQWIKDANNVLIIGPTGVGKTYLACALAHKACQQGLSALYIRAPKLYYQLALSRADGTYPKWSHKMAKVDLLVIDDLGLIPLTEMDRANLLEVIEDRHGSASTIVASQLPIELWHETIGEPSIADAILDRLFHNAYKITLKGESMRKTKQNLDSKDQL